MMDRSKNFIVLLVACIFTCSCKVNGYNCKNEQNETVDWYVLYKLPRIVSNTNILIRTGLAYLYITPDTLSNQWTLSSKSINSSQSIPGLTLAPLYTDSKSLHILYNDEPPGLPTKSAGHTKGVLLSDITTGLWLVHSVPHYPPAPSARKNNNATYSYPKSGIHYGQSFLCISTDFTNMDVIGKQLFYNQPSVYSQFIPPNLQAQLPNLIAVVTNHTVKMEPWYHAVNFTSTGNQMFQSFAKSSNYKRELYADWIASALYSNLLTETWQNGPGKLASNCTGRFHVENIKMLAISGYNVKFHSTVDHSKWAITNQGATWICIGDINRAEHQTSRGGGSVCFNEPTIWQRYKDIISAVERCEI